MTGRPLLDTFNTLLILLLAGDFELNPGPYSLTEGAPKLVGTPSELNVPLALRVGITPVPGMLLSLLSRPTILVTWPSPLLNGPQPLMSRPPPRLTGPPSLLLRLWLSRQSRLSNN